MHLAAQSSSGFDTGRVVRRVVSAFQTHGLAFVVVGLVACGLSEFGDRWLDRAVDGVTSGRLEWDIWSNVAASLAKLPFQWLIGLPRTFVRAWIVLTTVKEVADGHLRGLLPAKEEVAVAAQSVVIVSLAYDLALGLVGVLFTLPLVVLFVPEVRRATSLASLDFSTGLAMLAGLLAFAAQMYARTIWAVVFPVAVQEHRGAGVTFGRSLRLTRGHRWFVFGLLVVWAAAGSVVRFGAGELLLAGVGTPSGYGYPQTWAIKAVVSCLTSVVSFVIEAAIYVELVTLKDGGFQSALPSVFD